VTGALLVAVICIFLKAYKPGFLFIGSMECVLPLQSTYLFVSVAHFSIRLSTFFLLTFRDFKNRLDISPLLIRSVASILSLSVCPLHFL
jgi:hypothetical protein